MQFTDLRLAEPILRALGAEGYTVPTPIQAQAIPHVLEGRDLLGVAQTGTGKTAAFALPILNRLMSKDEAGKIRDEKARSTPSASSFSPHSSSPRRPIRCLILSPTRELAVQIGESFQAYGRHTGVRSTVIFGGVGQTPQVQALRSGVDVLVCTPGRLIDLMGQGYVDLRHVEVFVLDEADRMLDMGFIHDIRRVIPKLPAQRQNLMFSATMPREIADLAHTILRNPVKVEVTPASSTADRIEQAVYFVAKANKPVLLAHYLNSNAVTRALVFTRTKHGADRVVKQLDKFRIKAEAIHGNKSQNARQRALSNFKTGKTTVLIASDIASRGLDVDEISHIVNFDLPNEPETYVHRIGRTARAGASGTAVSFCDRDERSYLSAIQKLIRQTIPVRADHPTYPAGTQQEAAADRPMPLHPVNQQRHHAPRGPSGAHNKPHAAPGPRAGGASRQQGKGAGARRSPQFTGGGGGAGAGASPARRRPSPHPLAGRGKRFGHAGRAR